MDVTQIVVAAIAAVVVIGTAFFLFKRSALNEVSVKHGLDENAEKVATEFVGKAAEPIGKGIEHTGKGLEHTGKGLEFTGKGLEHTGEGLRSVGKGFESISDGTAEIFKALADRIRTKQNELARLKESELMLQGEIASLRTRHIDITEVTHQLKLSLIELSQVHTSFKQTPLASGEEGILWKTKKEISYLGVTRANFKLQVGIDLRALQFRLGLDNQVYVYGLRNLEVLGLKDLKAPLLMSELRMSDGGFVTSHHQEIEFNGTKYSLAKCQEEHSAKVLEEIQKQQSVENLKALNTQLALNFLKQYLKRSNLEVVEAEEPFENYESFESLCETVNFSNEKLIQEKKAGLSDLENRYLKLRDSVIEDVENSGSGVTTA